MSQEINIGIALLTLRKIPKEELHESTLRLQERLSLSSVELYFERDVKDEPFLWPWEYTPQIIKETKSLLSHFKIKGVHLAYDLLDFFAVNPRIRAESIHQIEEAIELSGQLGLDYVVAHKGRFPSGEEEFRAYIEIVERFVQLSQKQGIIFTLENGGLERVAKVVNAIDSPNIGITLDTGHAHTEEVSDSSVSLEGFIKKEGKLIKNIHLHDNDGKYDQHLPPGQGNINFPRVISLLKEQGYKGPVTLEIEPMPMDKIEESVVYLRRLE